MPDDWGAGVGASEPTEPAIVEAMVEASVGAMVGEAVEDILMVVVMLLRLFWICVV